jgi:hypothetical protein
VPRLDNSALSIAVEYPQGKKLSLVAQRSASEGRLSTKYLMVAPHCDDIIVLSTAVQYMVLSTLV